MNIVVAFKSVNLKKKKKIRRIKKYGTHLPSKGVTVWRWVYKNTYKNKKIKNGYNKILRSEMFVFKPI